MTPEQEEQLVDMIMVTAEVMGHELKPSAVMMMVSDLAEYDFKALTITLTRCRKELTGKLTLKGILDLLAPAGGWLSANEAWSRALPAADENKTVVWTAEARKAWFVALPMIEARDKVGARMAFIAAYEREVANAKNTGAKPQHEVSPGEDELLRAAAISQAQSEGLLPAPARPLALPEPTPEQEEAMAINREKIGEGLRLLSQSMRTGDTPDWMQEAAAKHKPAVMAALEPKEKGE